MLVFVYLSKCDKENVVALTEHILDRTSQLKFFPLVYFERSAMLILGH